MLLWRSYRLQISRSRLKAAAWLFHLVKDRLNFLSKIPPRSGVTKSFQPHSRQFFFFDTGRSIIENPSMGSILAVPACFHIPRPVKYSFLKRSSFRGSVLCWRAKPLPSLFALATHSPFVLPSVVATYCTTWVDKPILSPYPLTYLSRPMKTTDRGEAC